MEAPAGSQTPGNVIQLMQEANIQIPYLMSLVYWWKHVSICLLIVCIVVSFCLIYLLFFGQPYQRKWVTNVTE